MAEQQASVETDRRWRAFNEQGFACSCGEKHVGLFPVHIEAPLGWPGAREYEPDEALRMDGDFLSANYCVREGKYFSMRCRLPVRIVGADPMAFTYTVWTGLDRPDFEAYREARQSGKLNDTTRVTARLLNKLTGWPNTYNLMGTMFWQADGGWPVLFLHGMQADGRGDHPLLVQQRTGIGVDRMLELFALYGHDMKSSVGRP